MVDVNVEISVQDSPINNALDLYYDHIHSLLQPQTDQKIALNSTLVTFDILPQAPMFTEYVFRAYADRTVSLSPTDFGPVALGVANTNDRYSYFFTEVLRQAVYKLDITMPQDVKDKLDLIDREIRSAQRELQDFYGEILGTWNQYAQQNGIKGDDPYFLDKQTAYFNTMNFAERISYYKNLIGDNIQRMYLIRDGQYPDAEARHIASLLKFATLDQFLMARPKDPTLEEINKYDPIKLGQAYIYNNLNYFETSVEIRPSGYLPKFLTNVGKRDVLIKKGATATHQHDFSWSASGSASKWPFFKATVSASYESHLKETVSATNELQLSFQNLAEYWVNRGPWFASSVFGYKRIRQVLADNPKYAALLGFAVSSVVIGRGMALTMAFDKQMTFNQWSKFTTSASGGFSAFGISVPVVSGSLTDYKLDTKSSDDGKGVTFFDDPNHARLLAFRVDRLFDGAEDFMLAESKYLDETMAFEKGTFGKLTAGSGQSLDSWKHELVTRGRQKLLG